MLYIQFYFSYTQYGLINELLSHFHVNEHVKTCMYEFEIRFMQCLNIKIQTALALSFVLFLRPLGKQLQIISIVPHAN